VSVRTAACVYVYVCVCVRVCVCVFISEGVFVVKDEDVCLAALTLWGDYSSGRRVSVRAALVCTLHV
jgi:hypothetical protein